MSAFENAGATAYMNGEPNEWQRKSMKAVDDAMVSEWLGSGNREPLAIEYRPDGPSFPVGVRVARAGAEATPSLGP